jgi:AAA15 family ATPase/GTPase
LLIEFTFANFKSFRDENTLDMTATRISEHPLHVVEIGGDKLLSIAAIYGANASGKSNVFQAFDFMMKYVTRSFEFGGDSDKKNNGKILRMQSEPYLFDEASRTKPTTFEVLFIDNGDPREKTYQYGFSLLGTEVVEEWLYVKAKTSRKQYRTIFYRKKGEELQADGLTEKNVELIKLALEKEVLIVSLGSKLKIAKLKAVRDWFLKNEILDFGDPKENLFRASRIPDHFVQDRAVQKDVIRFFASFDPSIQDFKVEEVPAADGSEDKEYKIETLHKVHGQDTLVAIPLRNESSGTLKMFALYPSLKNVLENGGLLFVDELNARLHPLLLRNLILTFGNPELNPRHAQLIFTTHDVWQFSNEILRRDEIWIVDKDDQEVTSLYSVAEFKDEDGNKARKNEGLAKHYLYGEYGGIPTLSPLSMLKEGDEDGK